MVYANLEDLAMLANSQRYTRVKTRLHVVVDLPGSKPCFSLIKIWLSGKQIDLSSIVIDLSKYNRYK